MAVCSLTLLKEQACANGFMAAAEDEVLSRAITMQLLCNLTQDNLDFRITEEGELRVTEEGDSRVVTI